MGGPVHGAGQTPEAEHGTLEVTWVQHAPAGAGLAWSLLWGLVPPEPCTALFRGLHAREGAPTGFECLPYGQEFELWSWAAWLQPLSLSAVSWVRLGKDVLFVSHFPHLYNGDKNGMTLMEL